VWAKAEELGVPLFIHSRGIPELGKRLSGNGWLDNTIGYPLDATIALSHLIFEGTLDRFPGLKMVAAHGGGYLPSYAERSDHACLVGPNGCDEDIKLKKHPTEYLKQLYFDSLVFTPEALRHLVTQVGASQIMLGSDYPFPWELTKACRSHLRLDVAQRRRKGRHPRPHRSKTVQFHRVTSAILDGHLGVC
jgi:aminocarboxymuconate-semialdehyde decarboxylase